MLTIFFKHFELKFVTGDKSFDWCLQRSRFVRNFKVAVLKNSFPLTFFPCGQSDDVKDLGVAGGMGVKLFSMPLCHKWMEGCYLCFQDIASERHDHSTGVQALIQL